jgi:tRNA nucleotidyltransferase (CCA-adding enzyme)
MDMFENTIPTGIDYGTITVLLNDEEFEVTTYRKDHDYNGRRPKAITFSKTLEEDLKRRDFTINAMAMDSKGEITDLFGGLNDLYSQKVRFVGEPIKRVLEDKLRLIRGIRFVSKYDFEIPEEEYKETYMNATNFSLSKISAERFSKELNKILLSKNVDKGLSMLKETGILEIFIPEFIKTYNFEQHNPHHFENVFEHTVRVTGTVINDLELKIAALFHDIGKPSNFSRDENGIGHFFGHEKTSSEMARKILKRLKYPNDFIDEVCFYIENHMYSNFPKNNTSIRRFIRKVKTKERLLKLLELLKSDFFSSVTTTKAIEDYLKEIKGFKENVIKEMERKPVLNKSQLAINGNDLMNHLNIKPSKVIGKLLNELTEFVLEFQEENNKQNLLEKAEKIYKVEEKKT